MVNGYASRLQGHGLRLPAIAGQCLQMESGGADILLVASIGKAATRATFDIVAIGDDRSGVRAVVAALQSHDTVVHNDRPPHGVETAAARTGCIAA